MIEVEVHRQLRAFLREQGEPYWLHHLTMARLVARALRLGRSALIQTGAASGYHGHYRLSYLMPALIWQEPTLLVVPEALQQRLLMVEIPRLRQWINVDKPIRTGDRWEAGFSGLLLTSPQAWLRDRLYGLGHFPDQIPTIFDGIDDLESWARSTLTASLEAADWDKLMLACPEQADLIRDARVQLTRSIFQHPANPYDCYLIEPSEQDTLQQLQHHLTAADHPGFLPDPWAKFWQNFQQADSFVWTEIARRQGQFSLHCGPANVAAVLEPIWARQPIVLIGGALDLDPEAPIYRQRVGLDDLTCIKFSPDRQNELIQLYLPDGLPFPNTPQYQAALLQEVRRLLDASAASPGLTVILIGDTPLKSQVGSILASEIGSRLQVEKTCLDDNSVLVSGWEFWQQHQTVLPAPRLLIIATLPLPSLEAPLVAGHVAYYKRLRQDWFRLYLLPTALGDLQRSIAPVRESQGVVALLDNRVNHRSYGQQVLAALSPLARLSYVDRSLFLAADAALLD